MPDGSAVPDGSALPDGSVPAPGIEHAGRALPPVPDGGVSGVWARLTADSATAHRRLLELTAGPAARAGRRVPAGRPGPDELTVLVTRARSASSAARDRVRHDAAAAAASLSPAVGLDLPHDPAARAVYDDLAALVGAQRTALYRLSLLTVPASAGEHRFLVSGLRRALTDLEKRATATDGSGDLRVRTPDGWVQ